MKIYMLFLVIITAAAISEEEEEWNRFKASHRKMYRSLVEERVREKIFKNNLRKIAGHNRSYQKGEISYEMAVNQFADMTRDEFVDMLTLQKKIKPQIPKKNFYSVEDLKEPLPEKVNWTERGAVTGVKDQRICGSCWSFSTTGALEGQLFLKTGNLTSLSEQNLVDCVSDCYGCAGGLMNKALEYVRVNGIMQEDDYPYEARSATCRFQSDRSVTKIQSVWFIRANDEQALQTAVAKIGPVCVAIDATGLQFYSKGLYKNDFSCGNSIWNLNHGVLAVGYGTVNGSDYWLVKNSWGKSWGLQGYVLMARNQDNQCGIATDALFPQL